MGEEPENNALRNHHLRCCQEPTKVFVNESLKISQETHKRSQEKYVNQPIRHQLQIHFFEYF